MLFVALIWQGLLFEFDGSLKDLFLKPVYMAHRCYSLLKSDGIGNPSGSAICALESLIFVGSGRLRSQSILCSHEPLDGVQGRQSGSDFDAGHSANGHVTAKSISCRS